MPPFIKMTQHIWAYEHQRGIYWFAYLDDENDEPTTYADHAWYHRSAAAVAKWCAEDGIDPSDLIGGPNNREGEPK